MCKFRAERFDAIENRSNFISESSERLVETLNPIGRLRVAERCYRVDEGVDFRTRRSLRFSRLFKRVDRQFKWGNFTRAKGGRLRLVVYLCRRIDKTRVEFVRPPQMRLQRDPGNDRRFPRPHGAFAHERRNIEALRLVRRERETCVFERVDDFAER